MHVVHQETPHTMLEPSPVDQTRHGHDTHGVSNLAALAGGTIKGVRPTAVSLHFKTIMYLRVLLILNEERQIET